MSWRTIVISSSAKLDYKLDYLVVRQEEITKIHLSEISILLIENTAVSITAALLNELIKRKLKLFFVMKKEILPLNWFLIMVVTIQVQK